MPQTNGYGLLLTKLFTSTAARLCVGYDPQVPPCSQRMAAQPAYRETVQGVIGWQSCLLQQLQGSVWVTIHRYHHAAKGWQHIPHTERQSRGSLVDKVVYFNSCKALCGLRSTGTTMQPKDGSTPRIQRDSPGGHWLTKLFTSTAARLCVGYDPQVPPCSQKMAAQPAYREKVQGVIGWQSCLLQQLQGSVWVTIHRYHHAAKGWQHIPHTESGSTARIQRDSPGGHWDYVPLGESLRPPRDDHTPRIQKICHTRDANGARNKGRGLTFSISCMAEDISVPQGATHVIDDICLLHGISQSALPSILHQHNAKASWGPVSGLNIPVWRSQLPAGTETSRHLGSSYQQGVPILFPLIADLSGLWGSSMQVMHGRPQGLFPRWPGG